jgi:DNA-binding PucR family transcriptional regulator
MARVRDCAAKVNVLVDLFDDTYLAVGPSGSLRSFLLSLVDSRKGWEVGGIVSDPFGDLSQAVNYYSSLNRAIRVLRKLMSLNRFLPQSEINMFAQLFGVGDVARIRTYVDSLLELIDNKSHRQKHEMKRTLLSYFDNQYNIKRTAEALGVHINTVRQRLDTLRDITGGWDNPIKALELHVALRLSELMEE